MKVEENQKGLKLIKTCQFFLACVNNVNYLTKIHVTKKNTEVLFDVDEEDGPETNAGKTKCALMCSYLIASTQDGSSA
jgi:hypothetical protein